MDLALDGAIKADFLFLVRWLSNPNRNAAPYGRKYGFKVRDLTLHLALSDGSVVAAPVGGPVFTSNPDWPYAEGKRFPLGEDFGILIYSPSSVRALISRQGGMESFFSIRE